ncbi:tripeptidyl-peptidase 1 precursor [Mytilinidion resinicola]|uniref:tripeptidyl-peptidase II n=1 Tax=Mytilinidion resinicola TaxID=574789 RepID=A0A6A6Z0N0_9PEZI|nr:tripeptidyl-peptidase 1 precursor [Mytilinidion resinicola]KAF2814722.1 tripeptidyl-peptidase 1 precursor [Mytilinidion resinicola]
MLLFTSVLSVAIAAQAVFCSPVHSRSPYAVKETHNVPRQWKRVGRASSANTIDLHIGIKQGQFEELERQLYEVSDPSHDRYGKHLSHDEVNDLVKPSVETLDLVNEWLRDNGIESLSYSPSKDWISVSLPIETVERLLDTEYHTFEHERDGDRLVRTTKWSLPAHLHEHIDVIQPTTSFFRMGAQKTTYIDSAPYIPAGYTPPTDPAISSVCNVSSVTPQCFMELYGTKGYKPKAAGKNKVGFTNYLGEIPIRPDTAKFLQKYRPEAVSSAYTFKGVSLDGGPLQDGPLNATQAEDGISREANLDVQAIAGISWPTPIETWSTGGSPPFIPDTNTPTDTNEPYLVWVQYILSQKSIPQTITTSYGDDEQSVPKSYAERVCKDFARIGARGTSLLFSSGDGGVGDPGTCLTNDGKNTTQFVPAFPAGCPFVTAVGATMNFQPEEVAYRAPSVNPLHSFYASGAGFSNYFPRPKYQDKAVPAYVEGLNGKYDGLYNKSGRGYPDISAQGLYFAYVWNGTEGVISGTSASCPLSGGIISLVNDALIASGKPSLGFLNPWIYSSGYKGFTDITKGSTHGCDTDGFPAVVGWDPATGFGTPNFKKLVEITGCKF